jgi:hypothetical protein
MCVCDPEERSTWILDLDGSSSWRRVGDMKEARNQFSIVVVNFGVFAIGSGEEGLVEMFDEQGEEWVVVEQTLPVDIKLASLVVDRKILRFRNS